jgi:hypothetical protein
MRTLLLGPAPIRRSGISFSTYYDVITGRWVHPDEESPGSTIRIRLGAAMGRTFRCTLPLEGEGLAMV